MKIFCFMLFFYTASIFPNSSFGEPPALTTLSDPNLTYRVSRTPFTTLSLNGYQAVFVNHEAADIEQLPGHRAGYSGLASLTHRDQPRNVFVPAYAGLNFEHIFDGRILNRDILFEPRRDPMELRLIDDLTIELYQRPTTFWKLESCTRFQLLPKGVIEMTFECIPRDDPFKNDYIGLFWASYINQPESKAIYFRGVSQKGHESSQDWVEGISPKHGVNATHLSLNDQKNFPHDDDFPLSLVFNQSAYRFTEPWYYGLNHDMALVMMFRESDQIRFSQSPSGGGQNNPAWDFQWFIENPQIGKRYQMVMRCAYVKFESRQQIMNLAHQHILGMGHNIKVPK